MSNAKVIYSLKIIRLNGVYEVTPFYEKILVLEGKEIPVITTAKTFRSRFKFIARLKAENYAKKRFS